MKIEWFKQLGTSLRLIMLTLLVCSGGYPLMIYGVGRLVTPYTAAGRLVYDRAGKVIGSEIIAQNFTGKEYFWPRPSAVNYNAAGSGGSNLSPASPALRQRAVETLKKYGTASDNPIPADLVAASGSGLDPYISWAGAKYQIPRIAAARNITQDALLSLLQRYRETSGRFGLVNVLNLNQELDRMVPYDGGRP